MNKRIWVAAAAVLVSGLAVGQGQGPRSEDRGDRNGRPGAGPGQTRPADRPRPDSGRPESARPEVGRPDAGRSDRPGPGARPPVHRPPAFRPPAPGRRPPHRFLSGGGWRHSIRGPAFRYPPGFAYRAWTTGAILPPIFLSQSYFFDGYAPLGLGPPPPGYRWVRYGPDLLLVNIITGRVADVVDGVFY